MGWEKSVFLLCFLELKHDFQGVKDGKGFKLVFLLWRESRLFLLVGWAVAFRLKGPLALEVPRKHDSTLGSVEERGKDPKPPL